MSKGISVKVSRVKVLEALMGKLDDMEFEQAKYDIALKQYEEDIVKWKDAVAQIAFANFDITTTSKKSVVVRNWHSDDTTRVEVEVQIDNDKLPTEPQRPKNPFESRGHGRNYIGNYEDRKADILNAINILQLSDEDTVNTATYASVAKYL